MAYWHMLSKQLASFPARKLATISAFVTTCVVAVICTNVTMYIYVMSGPVGHASCLIGLSAVCMRRSAWAVCVMRYHDAPG